jgi:hypothetical protein
MSIKTITLTTHFFGIGWKAKLAHTRGYCLNIRMLIKSFLSETTNLHWPKQCVNNQVGDIGSSEPPVFVF